MGSIENKKWRGYSFDDLQYQKALLAVRIGFQKERLDAIRKNMVSAMSDSFAGKTLSLFNSNKNVVGYVIAGYKIFTTVKSLYKKFKKKS